MVRVDQAIHGLPELTNALTSRSSDNKTFRQSATKIIGAISRNRVNIGYGFAPKFQSIL